ncbi:MAG: histidine triad nucleotide-binding protein [Alphaproteobacteria bacterium]|nr:histidine triad nucleotide-binding protein [Alphaproteobacteria bacterium]
MTYDTNNIFARILRGEIPCDKVYEDSHVLAFNDIAPAAPVHVLVVPRGAYRSFDDFAQRAKAEEMQGFFAAIQKIAAMKGLAEGGYRLITNHGADASQTVHHFHVHILGGRPLGGLLAGDVSAR